MKNGHPTPLATPKAKRARRKRTPSGWYATIADGAPVHVPGFDGQHWFDARAAAVRILTGLLGRSVCQDEVALVWRDGDEGRKEKR
jgi:hypothetical protein